MYVIAFANLFVVMVSPNILEVVKDLMALTIISEIDDIFANGTGKTLAQEVCTNSIYANIFKIEVTTSKGAIDDEKNHKIRNRPIDPCEIHDSVVKNAYKQLEGIDEGWELEKYKLNRPKNIRIAYKDRTAQNKIFLFVYRSLRFFNVTIWIYFLPVIALILQASVRNLPPSH